MTTAYPVTHQYRSLDHLYLVKTPDPNTVLVRIYNVAQKCLHKVRVSWAQLGMLAADARPLAVVARCVELEKVPEAFAVQAVEPPTQASCRDYLDQMIQAYKTKIEIDPGNLAGLKCPITMDLFEEPVMDQHGHTFEKAAIQQHLQLSRDRRCPINRQTILHLTPNLVLQQQLDDVRAQDPIPTFGAFKFENRTLADRNFSIAREYIKEQEYEEALKSYTSAFQYTCAAKDYKGVVELFEKMEEKEKEVLSLLFLSKYYLAEGQVDKAIEQLEKAHRRTPEALEPIRALSELYLHTEQTHKASELISGILQEVQANHPLAVMKLCKDVLSQDPTQYKLYTLLAHLTEDSHGKRHLLLKGACHALAGNNKEQAQRFCRAALSDTSSFADRMVELDLMCLSGTEDKRVSKLQDLAREYEASGQTLDMIKAHKMLVRLGGESRNYLAIIEGYKKLEKTDKLSRWYVEWLDVLIGNKSYAQAEEVAQEALEYTENKLSIYEQQERIYAHYEGHKFEALVEVMGLSYTDAGQLEQAERVYRLGYERFGKSAMAWGLAELLSSQEERKAEAVQLYYALSDTALLEDDASQLLQCIESIKRIDPRMQHLDRNQRVQLLTQEKIVCLSEQVRELQERLLLIGQRELNRAAPAAEASKSAAAAPPIPLSASVRVPAMAFGKAKWGRYFGDVGIEPPLPADIDKILSAPCPFWPGKCVSDTHMLTLIPATVDGKPFCLDSLGELIKSPKEGSGGYATKYSGYWDRLQAELGKQSPIQSYWVLMTRDVLEGTRRKSYEEQQAILDSNKKGQSYAAPKTLEAAAAILMEHADSGQRLFGQKPVTYMRCEEQAYGFQAAVGSFGPSGLSIGGGGIAFFFSSGGLAGCRKF